MHEKAQQALPITICPRSDALRGTVPKITLFMKGRWNSMSEQKLK